MRCQYRETVRIFKLLRAANWIHGEVSRPKASRAIRKVLELDSEGDLPPPSSDYPHFKEFFEEGKTYSPIYIQRVLGVYRYLHGDYIGKKK